MLLSTKITSKMLHFGNLSCWVELADGLCSPEAELMSNDREDGNSAMVRV